MAHSQSMKNMKGCYGRIQVACLSDSEAHLALHMDDPFVLQTKPHGHGDVHSLLYSSGLLKQWVEAGVKWVAFFQDTNALVFRGLPAALGEALSPAYLLILQLLTFKSLQTGRPQSLNEYVKLIVTVCHHILT